MRDLELELGDMGMMDDDQIMGVGDQTRDRHVTFAQKKYAQNPSQFKEKEQILFRDDNLKDSP